MRIQGTRLRWGSVLVAILTLAAIQDPALSQDYPIKPIRLIVPYAAGGNGDILGRIVGQKLADALGKQVVIDNRPGANGIMGTDLCGDEHHALRPDRALCELRSGRSHAARNGRIF